MEIFSVNDEKFRKYGKVWNNIECTKLIKGMEHTPLPEDVIYVPSVEELEAVPEAKTFSERVFGGLPIQIGYCNGNNHKLNAVEYHRNSEINIAVTDMILLLKCVVILPKGTNTPIDFTLAADGEDKLMTAKNKWLIAHEEAAIKGAFNGLRGENISL